MRIPATQLEQAVINAMVEWLKDESRLLALFGKLDAREARAALRRAKELALRVKAEPKVLLPNCVERITVGAGEISIAARPEIFTVPDASGNSESIPESIATIEVPVQLKHYGMAVRLIVKSPGHAKPDAPDAKLIALLAKAYDWFGRLHSGRSISVSSLAAEEGVSPTWESRVIHLAFMAPDIVQRIARGEHPRKLTAVRLMRLLPLPEDWSEQRALLGFG